MEKELTGYASVDNPHCIGETFLKRKPFIPDTSVYDAINILTAFYRKNTAVDSNNLIIDYKQLFEDAITISKALKELGVKKGDIVSVSMPNLYQGISVFLACNRIGATVTFLNFAASVDEICDYLNEFESRIFVNYNKSFEENSLIKNKTKLKYIITLQKRKINDISIFDNYKLIKSDEYLDFHTLGSISKFQNSNHQFYFTGNNDALILFTSGSTGKPKAVVLTNDNILSVGTYLKNSGNVSNMNESRCLVCVPFSYPYGFATSTLLTLMSGKTAILAPNLSSTNISSFLNKKPNIVFGSPALLELIKNNVPSDQDLSSITTFISGGDFLSESQANEGREFFCRHGSNVSISNGSGNAETVGSGTNPVGQKIKPNTVGRVLVGCSAMIINPETMEEKKYYEIGELCISGRNVFKEYYNKPDLTKKSKIVFNGKEYFRTGTLGFLDNEGYFTLTGRSSRFYIMSSLNKVYLDHVQNVLSKIDFIDSVAVVKVPDTDNLFVNKAYIVLKQNVCPSELLKEKILELCKCTYIEQDTGDRLQLKEFEYPSYIEFVDSLPRLISDKIDYQLLEDESKNENKKNVKKLII